ATCAEDGGLRADGGRNGAERSSLGGAAQSARVRPRLAACLRAGCHDQGLSLPRRNAIRIAVRAGEVFALISINMARRRRRGFAVTPAAQTADLDHENS